jgi:hypothetical protein
LALAPWAAARTFAVSIALPFAFPVPTAASIPRHVLWNCQNVGKIDDRGL